LRFDLDGKNMMYDMVMYDLAAEVPNKYGMGEWSNTV
jgi:hypothetical protein